jgi:hypothetical protein
MTGIIAVMAGLSAVSSPNLTIRDFSSGSGTVTIPAGQASVVIEAWGGGGGGGRGTATPFDGEVEGGGGGGGGYSKRTIALTGGDAGKTLLYSVGAGAEGSNTIDPGNTGGTSTVASGTFILTSLIANGGTGGTSNGTEIQGSGGTASGGDTNTTGNGGALFTSEGAAARAGDAGLSAGGGGNGSAFFIGGLQGDPGQPGRVRFVFST